MDSAGAGRTVQDLLHPLRLTFAREDPRHLYRDDLPSRPRPLRIPVENHRGANYASDDHGKVFGHADRHRHDAANRVQEGYGEYPFRHPAVGEQQQAERENGQRTRGQAERRRLWISGVPPFEFTRYFQWPLKPVLPPVPQGLGDITQGR